VGSSSSSSSSSSSRQQAGRPQWHAGPAGGQPQQFGAGAQQRRRCWWDGESRVVAGCGRHQARQPRQGGHGVLLPRQCIICRAPAGRWWATLCRAAPLGWRPGRVCSARGPTCRVGHHWYAGWVPAGEAQVVQSMDPEDVALLSLLEAEPQRQKTARGDRPRAPTIAICHSM
jgi:hypothetical protein